METASSSIYQCYEVAISLGKKGRTSTGCSVLQKKSEKSYVVVVNLLLVFVKEPDSVTELYQELPEVAKLIT